MTLEDNQFTKYYKDEIVSIAMIWWCSNRPEGWSVRDHAINPTVNITNDPTGIQKRLAQNCAAYAYNIGII